MMAVTLDEVKRALRVTHPHMDDEIQGLIDAALSDLMFSGMQVGVPNEALVKRAVITYAKAEFGYDNPDAERLMKSYVSQKQALTIYGIAGVHDATS